MGEISGASVHGNASGGHRRSRPGLVTDNAGASGTNLAERSEVISAVHVDRTACSEH